MNRLKALDAPHPAQVPDTPLDMLREWDGPVALRLPGAAKGERRMAVTLLHGNEPSGVVALHRLLKRPPSVAVETFIVVAAVKTALQGNGFEHRMLPEERDLNRAFRAPYDDAAGQIAKGIETLLDDVDPEYVVDLHNNTGHNPAYGVVTQAARRVRGLVSLFTNRCVLTHLRLNTLLEAREHRPIATIECGQSGHPDADACAYDGLLRFIESPSLDSVWTPDSVTLYEAPLRVCLTPDSTVAISDHSAQDTDLTLSSDLERHNFERIESGAHLGWAEDLRALQVVGEQGPEDPGNFFRIEDGRLLAKKEVVPVMMTTDVAAARRDCLCYLLQEHQNTD